MWGSALTALDLERGITSREAGGILGLDEVTLQQHRTRGEGCSWYRIGRTIRYRLGDVLAYRDSCMVGASGSPVMEARGRAASASPLLEPTPPATSAVSGTENLQRACTTTEVAERLGISTVTMKKWRKLAEGPRWFRAGRSVRYVLRDVIAWQNARSATG